MQTIQTTESTTVKSAKDPESQTATQPGPAELSQATTVCPLWAANRPLQTKLRINTPGDRYEQEADRVADQVMRAPAAPIQRSAYACGQPAGPDGMCEACKRRQVGLQRATSGTAAQTDAPPGVHQTLQRPGCPLDTPTRNFMEARLGQDVGGVRVHNDAQAAASAAAIHARAYTVGEDMVFGAQQYAPHTRAGRSLLAHELTHVLQQRATDAPVPSLFRADTDAVSRVGALGNTIGSGIQFTPTNVRDTQVGPVSVRGGLLNARASRPNVIIGENLTPRILARQLLPLWTTATPFTPPGAAAPLPLVMIDEETLAKGLLMYNQFYIPVPAMTKWQSGLRLPLPVEIDEATGMATLNPTLIQNLANTFDPAQMPLLDSHAAATAAPAAATLRQDAADFLARNTTAMARGLHLGARAQTNAVAERPFIQEVLRQLGAGAFDVALAFMDGLVNRVVSLLAVQRDGAAILAEIQTALGAAPATLSAQQQASLDRANHMLGLVAAVAAEPPPTAQRTRAEKTVTVDMLKLDGSDHNPTTDIAVANAIYSQCNIRILPGVVRTATPAETTTWLGGDTDLAASPACGTTTIDERRMYRQGSATYGLTTPIRAFFVENTTASGYSFPDYCATGAARPFRGMAVIDNSGDTDTLAHELGHILINHGGHPASTLMAARPRGTLRINDWQCNRIYARA